MVRKIFFGSSIIVPLVVLVATHFYPPAAWSLTVLLPIFAVGWHDVLQTKHSLLRIYPVIGHGRYLMEHVRPEIQQYFVESDIDGTPFNREQRSVIYQRAKASQDTTAFGTQRNVQEVGYEWMQHSLAPCPVLEEEPRVTIGGDACGKPYAASHLNISAMSFGSLSRTAILALSRGARLGGFWHNTGEGSISPYHLEGGGDLVWQIGTGYFGCRNRDGTFHSEKFAEKAQLEAVKAIEVKLSQGAKPGHGGILPKEKITPEIAEIRGVPLGCDVISPPAHTAFSTPVGLLEFLQHLRELSGGKPVGFKLCVGSPVEFLAICKAMLQTGIRPDFITVDGGEGGTGAAPLELANSVGMPLRDGLRLVDSGLRGVGLREQIRIVASGKIVTGFDIFRALALGADLCNAARPMMLALGCIQARRCNDNTCPVGIATQDPSRYLGIDVDDKSQRVANFHRHTIHAFLELLAGAGLQTPRDVHPAMVLRRTGPEAVQSFAELYPRLPDGFLLDTPDAQQPGDAQQPWHRWWNAASAERWRISSEFAVSDWTGQPKAARSTVQA